MEIKSVPVDDDLKSLLAANDLPIDDVDDPAIALWGAYDGEHLVGVVGLQPLGRIGLLRSLAVTPAARSRGVARSLCETVFESARTRQLDTLWLLTTSARDYFTRLGFVAQARDLAPPELRATAQFASLCPASASVMQRPVR